MYCDLWLQYIQVRKLFKGENYTRAETIRGNTVSCLLVWAEDYLLQRVIWHFFLRFNKCIVPSGNKLPLVASKKSERLFWIFLAFSEYLNFKKYQIWKMHNENVLRRCPQRIHKEFDLILRPLKLCCQEVNALYSPLVAISVIGFQVLIMFLIPAYWNRGYTKGQIISKCLFGVINFL